MRRILLAMILSGAAFGANAQLVPDLPIHVPARDCAVEANGTRACKPEVKATNAAPTSDAVAPDAKQTCTVTAESEAVCPGPKN